LAAIRYRRQKTAWQVGLLTADVLSGVLALSIAPSILRWVAGEGGGALTGAWPEGVVLGAWLVASLKHPGYLPRPHRPLITTASQCLLAVATGSGGAIVLLYLLAPAGGVARELLIPATAAMFALTVVTRHLAGALASREAFAERYLILGNGDRSQAITDALGNGRHPHQKIVGLIPFDGSAGPPGDVPVFAAPDSVAALLADLAVTHAVVCQPQPLPRQVARCVAECEAAGVAVQSMEAAYAVLTRRAPIFHVGDEWIASLEASARTPYATRVKRVLDIVLAAAGLLVLSPLILLLALLVRLTSKGPAFYRQERVGRHGRRFTFTKLRTMVENAEAQTGPVWAAADDPRVTPIGRVLRRTRLDELPQLWSVLIGDMSLVGPRPERPHFVERFLEEIPLYGKRLLVLPGVTGWAQVHRSYDSSVEDVIDKLRYDLFYVNHVSAKLDLLILLKTLDVVLFGRGAR